MSQELLEEMKQVKSTPNNKNNSHPRKSIAPMGSDIVHHSKQYSVSS